MGRFESRSAPDVVTESPAARGAVLGLAFVLLDGLLLYVDTSLFGVLFLMLGAVLAVEGRDWWPAAGRSMAALGTVLLVSRLLAGIGPLLAGV
jgi:hypothetical protein